MGAGKVDQPEAGRDVPEGDAVQAPTQVRACGAQAAHPLGQAGAEKTATTGLGEVHSAAAKSCTPSLTRHSHATHTHLVPGCCNGIRTSSQSWRRNKTWSAFVQKSTLEALPLVGSVRVCGIETASTSLHGHVIRGNYSPSQANRLLLLLPCAWSLRVMSGTTQVRGNASRKHRTPRDANSVGELTLKREAQQCKHDGVSERHNRGPSTHFNKN